jgi:hypothetical protein
VFSKVYKPELGWEGKQTYPFEFTPSLTKGKVFVQFRIT